MLRSKFYVCPVCGNVIHSTGEMAVSCHGIQLIPEPAEASDEEHRILIERIEDEYYVQIDHTNEQRGLEKIADKLFGGNITCD